jgi:hypothetical protein
MNRTTLKAAGQALWGPHYRSELARACKVHLRTAMRWDRGETPIPQATWDRLAALLKARKEQIDKVLARVPAAVSP